MARTEHFEDGATEHRSFEKDPNPDAYWRNIPCPQGGCNTMLHPSRMHIHRTEKHPPTPDSIESQRRHQAWMKAGH